MKTINVLPDELIGKIAAGEVVERPASVVKELVENSIDSGASEITVFIKDGGRESISVADDGRGMSPDDLKICVLRHATSKISKAEDLFNIGTMGFRGEALPSIAAVSRLAIETKVKDSISGHKMINVGGKTIEFGEHGCPDGTRVTVEKIFFNTPARLKFLKSPRTEEGHILDAISRLAVAYPEIRFKIDADGKEKLSCLSNNNPRARMLEVFGKNVSERTISFEERAETLSLHGFLGAPENSAIISRGIYLFINRRIVRDRVLNHAVMDGYRSLLSSGSSPFAVIMLDIDPSRVDVNVHPTKQEVRFDNSGAIHNFVAMAVRKAITRPPAQMAGPAKNQPDVVKAASNRPVSESVPYGKQPAYRTIPTIEAIKELKMPVTGQTIGKASLPSDRGFFSSLRVIGQLFSSFIVCENDDEDLVVVDQHAAHERIGFERLKLGMANNSLERQQLLIPEQIELQPKEAAYINENLALINASGLEIEPFGGKTFMIKTVPAILGSADIGGLVFKLASELAEIGRNVSCEELKEQILKTIACHRQIRANHALKTEEMKSLLSQMDDWPNTSTCPHGRPTYKLFSRTEVSRWFERG